MNEHTKQLIKENILTSIEALKKEMLSRKEIKGLTINETLEKLTSLTFEKINQNNNEISLDEVNCIFSLCLFKNLSKHFNIYCNIIWLWCFKL